MDVQFAQRNKGIIPLVPTLIITANSFASTIPNILLHCSFFVTHNWYTLSNHGLEKIIFEVQDLSNGLGLVIRQGGERKK